MKTKAELGDDLCKYCPLEKKGNHGVDGGYMAGCEGSKCSIAYENYLEQTELQQSSIPTDVKQNLFNYFAEQHNIQLLESDFYEIAIYMKPESQQIAQEFAEWCAENAYDHNIPASISGVKIEKRKWGYLYNDGEDIDVITTSDLFAKFMEER